MEMKALSLIAVAAAFLYSFGRLYMAKRRIRDAADWPEAEATIQSAEMEIVARLGHQREELPFFSFSYVVDNEYYSGRFGLRVAEDQSDVLLRELIDTKVTVHYDPKRPSVFSLPDELAVEGFRVSTVPEIDLASEH